MFYEFSIVVPANTNETDPYTVIAPLVPGVITRVEVQFWAGHRGNVHVRIFEKEHQIWPTNLEGWLTSENHTIAFDEEYQIVDAPYELRLEGYNEDTDYDHEVRVRFRLSVGLWTLADLAALMMGPTEVVYG